MAQHGHFVPPPDEPDWRSRYEPLRVPAGPSRRDFVVRRVKDPETGEIVTELRWNRPRYELPGLNEKTRQVGITDIAERRPGVVDLPGGPAPVQVPPTPVDPLGASGGRIAFTPAQSIDEASEVARQLGVQEVDFGDRLDLANWANEGLTEMAQRGVPMPRKVGLGRERFSRKEDADSVPAAFHASDNAILLNDSYAHWSDLETRVVAGHADGRISTAHPYHPIRHELGHCEHYRQNREAFVSWRRQRELSEAERTILTAEVSRYGASQPVEAVAEIWAGLCDGRTYSDDVMSIYRKFGGPELPSQ